MNKNLYLKLDNMNEDKLFDYALIRAKGSQVEYEIYSYNKDGSFDDWYQLVILHKDVDIEQYIRENFGMLLSDYED